MDPNTRALIMGAAGAGSAEKIYVEDVFSTWLYTGNGSTQTITNGIDLSGKGGLVWIKDRSAGYDHRIYDTARGVNKYLSTNLTSSQTTTTGALTAFNSNGFSLGPDDYYSNFNGVSFSSWTFRKAAKFFDVVIYTGSGANRTIAHSLGSVPGTIIVKRTDTTGDWQVYHRSLANTDYMVLNSTAASATGTTRWNSTTPTSTDFSLGTDATVNANGGTYVAYLFALGDSGADNVVSCGSYTGNGSATGPTVSLGWEPQWLLIKRTDSTGDWQLIDNMRGFQVGGAYAELNPNLSAAESSGTFVTPLSTGFQLNTTDAGYNANGGVYIYIAIRRGPMKTPTDATKVFDVDAQNGGSFVTTSFPVDLLFPKRRTLNETTYAFSRLQGAGYLETTATTAEQNYGTVIRFDSNLGIEDDNFGGSWATVYYSFRRAPGFFDAVCYTGTGSARTVTHNLGVAPELMIVKKRSAADAWVVYANNDNTDYLVLNTTAATVDDNTIWNDTSPTSSVFTVGTNDDVNGNTATFVAYLFASCSGVSKVGSYTGTGTTLNVDCGFTNGARFVLIKRTDSTGDWYAWDTARGIVSGDDPYLLLNSSAAEVTNTDYIDPLSSGFQISSTAPAAINANGGSYIYLSVA